MDPTYTCPYCKAIYIDATDEPVYRDGKLYCSDDGARLIFSGYLTPEDEEEMAD